MTAATRSSNERPRILVTTDVNGTTTPHNTFGELVRADGLFDDMERLMKSYTSGNCKFSEALPKMKSLAESVDRGRLESYARTMPFYPGVKATIDRLTLSERVDAKVALSTTGFAGLMALVSKCHHGFSLSVAASPVLVRLLDKQERSCLIRPITDEEDKVQVIDELAEKHNPHNGGVIHIGDTMGDYPAIRYAAELGGVGVAFRPNEPLKKSISKLPRDLRTRICEIDFAADEEPDFHRVGDVVRENVWKTLRTEL